MKTLVVGDIHGCFEELKELLDLARLGPDDRLIALGDVAGRGPESAQVLTFLMERANTSCIMGNHEWKHVQGYRGLTRRIVRRQCGEELYARALTWMRGLPLFWELPEALIIHWGLEPGLAVEHQDPAVLLGLPEGEQRLTALLGSPDWYRAYEGERKVVYGHHSWAAGVRRNLTYGIDTGCVYGSALTGLLLPEFELLSVQARENHWARLQAEWSSEAADTDQN